MGSGTNEMRVSKRPKSSDEPRATRPHMPGYGVPKTRKGLLPWSWARNRLSKARNYWVSTTCSDGKPHSMAVWGLWLNDKFVFSTSPRSLKARNVAKNPWSVVCPERADEAVVLEGIAEILKDPSTLKKFVKDYKTKYDWDIDTSESPVYAVRPVATFGFVEKPKEFSRTATKWKFPQSQNDQPPVTKA